jgi:putative ABC transport system permease protein
MKVNSTSTTADIRQTIMMQFNMLIVLIMVMCILLAVVGGLGLMATMSLNVLERTREIGVMRAIGASDGAITRLVISEGILIGLMSFAIGAALAFPLGKLLSDMIGAQFLHSPLSYTFSMVGLLIWFGLVTLIAVLASLLPARNATRLSVRETLAYE